MPCHARQYSDQMICGQCGLSWDTNDPDAPACRPVFPADASDERKITMKSLPGYRRAMQALGQVLNKPPTEKPKIMPTENVTLPDGRVIHFADMVAGLKKAPSKILETLARDGTRIDALHMAVGVSGEAGELLDAVKKFSIYGKDLDRENVVEELGDLEFYMEGLRQRLGITRQQTLEHNALKLGVRYPTGGYRDQDAIDRADKA